MSCEIRHIPLAITFVIGSTIACSTNWLLGALFLHIMVFAVWDRSNSRCLSFLYIYLFVFFKEIKILPDYRVLPKLSHSYTPCVFRGEIYFLLFEKNI